jgi:hypothetical protein
MLRWPERNYITQHRLLKKEVRGKGWWWWVTANPFKQRAQLEKERDVTIFEVERGRRRE